MDDFFNLNKTEMHPDVSIHIFSNSLTVVDIHKENRRNSINFHDIPKLLNINITSPMLNIRNENIVGVKYKPPYVIYFVHYKSHTRTIHLENPPTSFDFFYKDLLFMITTKDNIIENSLSIFTFEDLDKKIYQAPLFNLNKSGSMCMGSIKRKPDKSESITEFLDKMFFNSIFTHTSFVPQKIQEKGKLSDYLYKNRKTGWDFKDLTPYKKFSELGEDNEI